MKPDICHEPEDPHYGPTRPQGLGDDKPCLIDPSETGI